MMRQFFKRPYVYSVTAGIVLILYTAFVLLEAFVIPQTLDTSSNSSSSSSSSGSTSLTSASEGTYSDSSYEDDNIKITITTKRVDDTTVYIADIVLKDSSLLQTAFAEGTYGKNIKEATSVIAEENDAILAINGDYYGFRNSGYVIRNGVIYRDTENTDSDYEDLVIYDDGSFSTIDESEISAEELLQNGAVDVFSFGPTLVSNSEISVNQSEEVDQSMASNPRTAIGIISENHYVFVVSDGRTSASEGLSLYSLAEVMQDLGCTIAYNLDGGGSSTMYFNGEVVNIPTTNGNSSSERKVSDIVYIGY